MQPPLAPRVTLQYEVTSRDDWILPEGTVPESRPHDLTLDLLKALLSAWAARTGRKAQVGRNLAVRWNEENPRIGTDPDIYVVEPRWLTALEQAEIRSEQARAAAEKERQAKEAALARVAELEAALARR